MAKRTITKIGADHSVKQAVIEALEPFAKAVQKDFGLIHEEILGLQTTVKDDVRGLKVLVENSNHEIKIIAEQHTNIAKRLDKIEKRLTQLETSTAEIKISMIVIQNELKALRPRIESSVDLERFQALERRVEILESAKKLTK